MMADLLLCIIAPFDPIMIPVDCPDNWAARSLTCPLDIPCL